MQEGTRAAEGGWGWVVVFGSFLAQALTAGEASCLGLFLLEWLEEFQVPVSSASWIISIIPILTGFLSPVSSVLGARFGYRLISCFGAILASVAAMSSSFATSVTQLYFTLSILLGVGCGFIYAPSSVIVGIYFKERFVLAITIASSGVIIGQITLPQFFAYLISAYGWRGALLIIGAFNMHMLVCACLFRPLVTETHHRKRTLTNTTNKNGKLNVMNDDAHLAENISNKDANFSKNITNEDEENTKVTNITNGDGEQIKLHEFGSDNFEEARVKTDTNPSKTWRRFAAVSKATGIPELCYTMHFPVLLLSAFTIGVNIYCYYIYTPLRASEYGYSKNQLALLLSVVGIGSLLGRIFNVIFIEFKCARIDTVFTISLATLGIVFLITPLSSNFGFLIFSASAYGISLGISSTLMLPMAREVSPARLVAPVIGIVILCFALGNGFGAYLGGWLFDLTGNYEAPFYTCGAASIMTTIMFLPTLRWLRRNKRTKTNEQTST